MHMHSGGHARKRIDFYILLCGIWCFPHRTRFCFSFFPRERDRERESGSVVDFSYFIFHFSQCSKLKLNSSLRIAYKKATARTWDVWDVPRHRHRLRLHHPLPDVTLSKRIQQFHDAASSEQRGRAGSGQWGARTLNDTCGSGNMCPVL